MSPVRFELLACDGCGFVAEVRYFTGGWWSYPDGWWVLESDAGSMVACSVSCAEKLSKERELLPSETRMALKTMPRAQGLVLEDGLNIESWSIREQRQVIAWCTELLPLDPVPEVLAKHLEK